MERPPDSSGSHSGGASDRTAPDQLTLLLVDDTPANLVALKAILDQPGYRLLVAHSGAEALNTVLHTDVDVILLDVVMPDMDGFEVARHLKTVARTRHIPVLFLTAIATDIGMIYRAYDVGAVDYLIKPLDSEIVRKKVAVFADLVLQRRAIERHAAEMQELQRREYVHELRVAGDRRYRKLVDGIDHAIAWTADESLRVSFVSRQAPRLLGYSAEQIIEPDFWAKHLHPDDRELVMNLFRSALAEGSDLVCNHRIVDSQGRDIWFHTGVSGERGVHGVTPELHGFSVDVSDIKSAEEAARQATQARDSLLAIVSHDLRTPLNMITLSAGLIGRALANLEGSSQVFRHAATILRCAAQMDKLIAELLDLAQLDGGGLAIECKPTDAAALVRESVELLTPAATAKNLRLESRVASDLIVNADRDRLLQVMSNLLGNAIKFTHEAGEIDVAVERVDSEAQFSITDNGPGIAAAELDHIWRRFWQAKREGGIGLGLTIAKGLIDAHGGRIWVESQVGRGTTFFFTLPLTMTRSSQE
jgi:PAS domain S-box-containing protein